MELQTIDIKGKEYVTVNERVKAFRLKHPLYSLVTTIIEHKNGLCLFRADVLDENGRVIATGHAFEKEDSSFINKTSYVENAETSAIGRALGNFGIGIDSSYCTADEIVNAISNQPKPKEAVKPNIDSIPNELILKISSDIQDVKSVEALNVVYKKYTSEAKKYPSIQALFTNKKKLIQNAG